MTEKLYLVTVPVAFLMRSSDEHKMTNAYFTIDAMSEGAIDGSEMVYFGEVAVAEVF